MPERPDTPLEQINQSERKALLESIKAGKEFDASKAILCLFLHTEFEGTKVTALSKKVDDLAFAIRKLECNEAQTKVQIRNLPTHKRMKRGQHETPSQTSEMITKLFDELDLHPSLVKDSRRLPMSEKAKKNPRITTPIVALDFVSFHAKMDFTNKLKLLKDSDEFKDIHVSPEIPASLRDDYAQAAKKAFDLRKKGTKTRIKILSFEIALLTKSDKDDQFKPMARELWHTSI